MHSHPDTPPESALHQLAARERRIAEAILRRTHVARDVNRDFLDTRSFGDRLADRIAAFGGSWPFILSFLAFLTGWMVLNSGILAARHESFDPYPYILLNLILSTLAALQAPVIMMSQNRQATRDRLDAANDYEVNLKAETEIRALHDKLDALREADWAELVRLQQVQIEMLQRLLAESTGSAPRRADAP
ncbi:DUF1003 domain-containing protein [Longimicrobium sp.]|uniref:DUF1003 domain-containing protein n=1 Tax=Longimicrobium sp. TaxID=2029185 RepID=UPI002E37E265|nr:DUF1003 domain-containing protein [Longimicrobium sp.]HEX6041454.1 DUF1003 domain-containing protein [Longimicrobium sp.]